MSRAKQKRGQVGRRQQAGGGEVALREATRELEQARRDLAALRQRSEEQEAAAAAAAKAAAEAEARAASAAEETARQLAAAEAENVRLGERVRELEALLGAERQGAGETAATLAEERKAAAAAAEAASKWKLVQEATFKARLQEEIVKQEAAREDALAAQARTANEAATALGKQLADEAAAEREALRAKLEAEAAAALAASEERRRAEAAASGSSHEQALLELQLQLERQTQLAAERAEELGALRAEERALREQLVAAGEEARAAAAAFDARYREQQQAMAAAKEAAKEKLETLLGEQVDETRKLTSEFQHAQELTQSQVATLSAQLKELQAKLDNREPRPEDVQLIESLRRQMKEKDEMVRRTPRGQRASLLARTASAAASTPCSPSASAFC